MATIEKGQNSILLISDNDGRCSINIDIDYSDFNNYATIKCSNYSLKRHKLWWRIKQSWLILTQDRAYTTCLTLTKNNFLKFKRFIISTYEE